MRMVLSLAPVAIKPPEAFQEMVRWLLVYQRWLRSCLIADVHDGSDCSRSRIDVLLGLEGCEECPKLVATDVLTDWCHDCE